MVFLEGTRADLGTVTTQLTAFTAQTRTQRGVDLSVPPFDSFRKAIASPAKYADTQALGAAMRAAGVDLIRYPSARDPMQGINVAAFGPSVFGKAKPRDL